ncbi:MAG: DUF2202 domain-containing protein [Myxococcales bacterium]|nr:DUF2202 domain-containing protein [Myxococcales bacterium]
MTRTKSLVLASVVFLFAAAGCDGEEPIAGSDSDQQAAVADGAGLVDGSAADGAAATPGNCVGSPAEDLCFLREEEKLARDVYIELYKRWGIPVFDNISASEQTHTDAVRDLLAARGITDPVTDDTVGVLRDAKLAALYAQLVGSGQASQDAALTVGATIEDLDIHDINEMRSRSSDPAVLAVYDSLRCGSRNHLRAFVSQLASRGVTYNAQYISAQELAAIVSSSRETCGR